MAQCAPGKKPSPSAIDSYVGALHSKLYSSNRVNRNVEHWSRYNGESFRKELSPHQLSSFGGSFREDKSKPVSLDIVAKSKVVNGVPENGNSLRSSHQNSGLFVGATKMGGSQNGGDSTKMGGSQNGGDFTKMGGSQNGCDSTKIGGSLNGVDSRNASNGIVASPICNGSTNASAKKLSGELSNAKATMHSGTCNGTFPKKENGDAINSRVAHYSNGDLTKTPEPTLAVGFPNGAPTSRRTHKSGDFDVVNSTILSRNWKSGELNVGSANGTTRAWKSGEQTGVTTHGSSSLKSSPSALSPNEGKPSLRIGRESSVDSSSNGCSSNGGSPTSEAAKGGGRSSSASNNLTNGSSPGSVSSRGIGNIIGAGNITGNLKLSATKTSSNDSQPATPAPLRSANGSIRKLDEMVANGNGNLRGMSTPKGCGEGNLNGGIITGPATPNVGNLYRGNCNGNVLNCGNVGNKANGKMGCANGNVLSSGIGSKINGGGMVGDCNQMKKAWTCADPEEIKNAGNEQYRMSHFSEALALYDKAIALCPTNASYRSNRAAALTGLQRLGEAVQECEEAIRLDPCYARAHHRAASLYLRLGLVESAKRHFQAAGQQADLGDIQRLQNVERHISKCIEARKLGDWKSVIRESDAAVVAGADSAAQIFGYKSEALLKLHRLDEADRVCTAAQRIESSLIKPGVAPPDSFLLTVRAQIEMALGRFEAAIGAAESAARMDPRNTDVAALLRKARAVWQTRTTGNELFKAGRFFEACALYGEGLESDPSNAVLLCNRAACRSKLGQWEKAIEDCDAALNIHPSYTKALMRRAQCSTKLERWEDALRDYEVLRREMPGDMEVARGLFDVQVAIKKSRGEEIYKMKFGGDVEEVSNNDQFREAVTSPGLSVVQFNTRWSDRCRQISPFIDQLCKRYPCVTFVKVDVDDNPYLAKTESVSFVPTFKIYKNGQKVKEILGPSQQSLEYAVKHYSL